MAKTLSISIANPSGGKTSSFAAGLTWTTPRTPPFLARKASVITKLGPVDGYGYGLEVEGMPALIASIGACLPADLAREIVIAAWIDETSEVTQIICHRIDQRIPVLGDERIFNTIKDFKAFVDSQPITQMVCNAALQNHVLDDFKGSVHILSEDHMLTVTTDPLAPRYKLAVEPLALGAGAGTLIAACGLLLAFGLNTDSTDNADSAALSVTTYYESYEPDAFLRACRDQINFTGPRLYRHQVVERGCSLNMQAHASPGPVFADLTGPIVWQRSEPGALANPTIARRVVERSQSNWNGGLLINARGVSTGLALTLKAETYPEPPQFEDVVMEDLIERRFFGLGVRKQPADTGQFPANAVTLTLNTTLATLMERLKGERRIDVLQLQELLQSNNLQVTLAPRKAQARQRPVQQPPRKEQDLL